MKASEIRAMDGAGLEAAVLNARQEVFNLRFQRAAGQVQDTTRFRAVRRELARLLTVHRERELWAAFEATGEKE